MPAKPQSPKRQNPQAWREAELARHGDGKARCPWCGEDPLYIAYHDEEWGRPEHSSQALFEKLALDGFQAGLSWITILRKRDAFRRAFEGFDPERVARFDAARVEALMGDTSIVRNRAKIEGVIVSAQAYLEIEAKTGFSRYLWDFVDGAPIVNRPRRMSDVPAQTPLSERISKDLRAKGFKFCGPTVVYAFMQAVGMIDDHLADCFRAQE
jgi:DNA-3-methyladenine glycosylase I